MIYLDYIKVSVYHPALFTLIGIYTNLHQLGIDIDGITYYNLGLTEGILAYAG
ncbi:hypothetical protein SATMO3_18490 [Sporomusa aerivorans]